MQFTMSTQWSKTTRYIVGVCLFLFGIFVLYLCRSIIPLLIVAALIAVFVRPLVRWLHEQVGLARGLAVMLVYLLVAILVPLALVLAVPAIVDAVHYVLKLDYRAILQNSIEWLRSTLTSIKAVQLPISGLDATIDQAADAILSGLNSQTAMEPVTLPSTGTVFGALGTALSATFRTVTGVAGSVFSWLTLALFVFLTSIHISLNAHTFTTGILKTVPERFRPEIAILIDRIVRVWGSFFRGELTLMLVIGVMSWVGLTVLGVPGAPYLGIVAGLLELIPNLGPIIATIPAVIIALLQGSTYLPVSPLVMALIVVGFYILVQQFENNLIVPRVLGDAVDLPALVVMTGVFVGAEIGGLLGALLATPVIATGREIIKYVYHKILGEEPFPPVEETPKPIEKKPSPLRVWWEVFSREKLPQIRKAPDRKPFREKTHPTASDPENDEEII
jgi:predicted PurR-regulated permease PerM